MEKVIADLHIHSRFARACSSALNLANLEKWARVKGITLLGTGDFTHPDYLQEIKSELSEDPELKGVYVSKSGFRFVLQSEICCIWSSGGRRSVHSCVLAPSLEVVDQVNAWLSTIGNLKADGRPMLGLSCAALVEGLRKISGDIEIFPAHLWTPWFGAFGSDSGFDSLEECYGDQVKHVHAIETGMSSDPQMNWRVSELDSTTILSNSDCHSFWPWRLGRECNVFEFKKPDYAHLLEAIRGGSEKGNGLIETIEVDPNYGKYHFDGHRNCGFSCSPEQSRKLNNTCPACRRPLTLGVEHRVEDLSEKDRGPGFVGERRPGFKKLIPLSELISLALGSPLAGKKTWAAYNALIERFGTEFNVLLEAGEEELERLAPALLTKLVLRNRAGLIKVKPGFDGVYGEPLMDGVPSAERAEQPSTPSRKAGQKNLLDYA
ncbi:MAG TPA: endonuclease Q family protein [archaeon]|nr:endonuclease Q family protein [archaeon]